MEQKLFRPHKDRDWTEETFRAELKIDISRYCSRVLHLQSRKMTYSGDQRKVIEYELAYLTNAIAQLRAVEKLMTELPRLKSR